MQAWCSSSPCFWARINGPIPGPPPHKCVRAGGKHNDLENVGRTARHHTFSRCWELLVRGLLQAGRHRVCVGAPGEADGDRPGQALGNRAHQRRQRPSPSGGRDRALSRSHHPARRQGQFLVHGRYRPCGPCSEIIFDQGPAVGCGRPECRIGECECDRYLGYGTSCSCSTTVTPPET